MLIGNGMRVVAAVAGFCAGSAAMAAPSVRAPKPMKPLTMQVLKPDFAVSAIQPAVAPNSTMDKVTVTIVDLCNSKATSSPYVTVVVTGATPEGSAQLGYNAPFVSGAASSQQTLSFGKPLPAGATIRVSVNDDKSVPEARSGNNFRQINPDIAPFPPGKNYCLPANYE